MNNRIFVWVLLLLLPISMSCGSTAMNMVANALSSTTSGTVFTGDDDPELVGDALPFALKLYESLLDEVKDNPELYLSTGSAFIMYANAYVQTPADMLPDEEYEKKSIMTERARKLYIRGRDYVISGIEIEHPGFAAALYGATLNDFLKEMEKEDVPYLYWCGAGWMAAYATDPFNVDLGIGVKKAAAMMETGLRLDESYNDGAIHEFFVLYYGSLPQSMGGSEEKARYHFQRAVEIARGRTASPYVSLASTVSVNNQDAEEYTALLTKALAVDVSQRSGVRLVNIIAQRKARWLLDHREDRILSDIKKGVKQ
ncbi:MAG: TRAP transporter TatT component family protein [Spirochaetes bacterium]|nr:TRAP transporter TatT component family protein [Spirochaetota bacterium]